MTIDDPIAAALSHLGWWRVVHVQADLYPYHPIPASVMLGIGERETGLQNICGGATWNGTSWVRSFTDRGWLQISDQVVEERAWLATVQGCKEGSWWPDLTASDQWQHPLPGTKLPSALEPRYCPRFTDALYYTKKSMLDDMEFGDGHGVAAKDLLRFAIAAHNAGPTGALKGYEQDNVDLYTAHGNYSAYVLSTGPEIHDWISRHSAWEYRPAWGPTATRS